MYRRSCDERRILLETQFPQLAAVNAMVSILDRYFIKEFAKAWLAVTVILLIILISSRLARYLGEAAAGLLPGSAIFLILGLKLPGYLVVLLPLTFYLGILLAFGRLQQDSEITAMNACGVGYAEFYRPLLMLSLPFCVGLGVLSLYFAPSTAELAYHARERALQMADIEGVGAGRFKEARNGERLFFVERIATAEAGVENIFIQLRRGDRLQVQTAQSAYYHRDPTTGERFLVMRNGHIYEGNPGSADYRIIDFARQVLRLPDYDVPVTDKLDARPTAELWRASTPAQAAHLHARLSAPVTALLLALLTVPLSRTTPRSGRYGRLLLAVIIYLVFVNLNGAVRVFEERGLLTPGLGIWGVHVLLLLFIAGLWRQGAGFKIGSKTRAT